MSAAPRIGILGAGGRMGRTLIQAVQQAGYQLAAAVERPESSLRAPMQVSLLVLVQWV